MKLFLIIFLFAIICVADTPPPNTVKSKTYSGDGVTAIGNLSDALKVSLTNSSIPVTGSFYQTVQPVSGDFYQSVQPVSAPSPLPVTGTFWQATQPVSAASLPLPTGASTLAAQISSDTTLTTINGKLTSGVVSTPLGGSSASEASGTVSTVITLTAPANAQGFILQNHSTSTVALRYAMGATATSSVGVQLQPGQDSGYVPAAVNVSLVAESGTQNYSIQWVIK